MNSTALKRYRPASLVLFGVSFIFVVVALLSANHNLLEFSALFAFAGIGYFMYTEAFLFSPPARSSFNVWLARALFVVNVLVVAVLVFQLLNKFW